MLEPTIRQILFDVFVTTMLVFAPRGTKIFVDFMTLELLMDFLTPSTKTADCFDWSEDEPVDAGICIVAEGAGAGVSTVAEDAGAGATTGAEGAGAGVSATFSSVVPGPGSPSASRTAIVTSRLALL
jgi:hypothetical protein